MDKYSNMFHLESDASEKAFVVIRDHTSPEFWVVLKTKVMFVSGFI